MRIAPLAYLCLLFWAGSFVLRSSANESPRPSALDGVTVPVPEATTRKFESAELKQLLATALQAERIRSSGEVDLTLTRPWQALDVPKQEITLRIVELPAAALSSQFIVRFELRSPTNVLGTWQTAVQLKVWREIWVAGSNLKRGDSLDRADLTLRRYDVLTLREPASELPVNLHAYELSEFVAAGAPLLSRAIKAKPVVRRGQSVDAVAQNGALTVTLRVEVLEEGAPGQIVRVRNPQSRRELRGKVQDENTIVVPL